MTWCTCPVTLYWAHREDTQIFEDLGGYFLLLETKPTSSYCSRSEKRELQLIKTVVVTQRGCYCSELCSWTREVGNRLSVTFVCDAAAGTPLGQPPKHCLSLLPLKHPHWWSPSVASCHINVMSFGVCCYCLFVTFALACVKDINCKEKGNEVQLTKLSTVRRYCFFLTMSCNYLLCRYHDAKKWYRVVFQNFTC